MPHVVNVPNTADLQKFQPDIIGFKAEDTLLLGASLRERKSIPVDGDSEGNVRVDLRSAQRPITLELHIANQENLFLTEPISLE